MREVPCPACGGRPAEAGRRWRSPSAGGRSPRSAALPIGELRRVPARARADRRGTSRSPSGCSRRSTSGCGFLLDVGLDYLSLDRAAGTLSGGEAQRIRLATQIGSGLVGVLYVLDEPSIGLHQRDNHRLIETLVRLRDLGNTLIVVEHDEDTIRTADWVVDIGPGAGEHGGAGRRLRARRGPAGQPRLADRRRTCPGAGRSRCRRSAGRRPRAAS